MNILENVRLSLSSTITTRGMSCGYQGWAPKWNLSESGSVATGPSWRSARAREQLPWGEAGSAAAEPPASSLGQGQHRCRFTLRTRFPASGDLHLHSLPLSSSRLSSFLYSGSRKRTKPSTEIVSDSERYERSSEVDFWRTKWS